MEYTKLGKSDLNISRIGFGCMSLTGSDQQKEELLESAFNSGINFFDTADLYERGQNEITVGKWLKEKRKEVVIATKVGNQWRKDGSGWDWNPRKSYILAMADESLHRLQTDYIDLYQLHGGTINDPIDETIEAFELLKQQGKIRYYGISSIRPNVIREYINRSAIVSVMMQYSLLDRRPEETCLLLLQENNIGVLARGSLAQGLLVNKPAKEYLGYKTDEVSEAAKAVESLTVKGRKETQVAIRFVLQNTAITSSIIGIRNISQLKEAISSISSSPLTENEMEKLKSVLPAKNYSEHR
jgi:aryl-alcohol dehydrogenase-like predicted oxidoreductase